MPNQEYPQDLMGYEEELGFDRWIIPSIRDRDRYADMIDAPGDWPFVVAKILLPSEILLKIYDMLHQQRILYSHRVCGSYGDKSESWMPIGNPTDHAGIYLQERNSGAIDIKLRVGHGFKPLNFRHWRKS
jgi:hypothetical protein